MESPDLNKQCGICGSEVQPKFDSNEEIISYRCPICGRVRITLEAALSLVQRLQGQNHLLSGFTRERTELGLEPIDIRSSDVENLARDTHVPRNVSEKLDRVMLCLERKSEHPGKTVAIIPAQDYSIAYAKNSEELEYLLKQLVSLNWIESPRLIGEKGGYREKGIVLTVDGWNRLAELDRYRKVSDQAFVAMWFTEKTQKAYDDGIAKAIEESGFKPLRVDKLEHNNLICDVIIAGIRRSAFLVADFTGHRGGVYFEAGFALGLGIPVIWLCHKDDIKNAHFDTQQYNHIVWENEAELYQKLLNRINATIIIDRQVL